MIRYFRDKLKNIMPGLEKSLDMNTALIEPKWKGVPYGHRILSKMRFKETSCGNRYGIDEDQVPVGF